MTRLSLQVFSVRAGSSSAPEAWARQQATGYVAARATLLELFDFQLLVEFFLCQVL
jgi:hypothetical protein